MIGKNLARRLERLESEITPAADQIAVFHIQFVTPDRQVVSTMDFTVRTPPPRMKPRFR